MKKVTAPLSPCSQSFSPLMPRASPLAPSRAAWPIFTPASRANQLLPFSTNDPRFAPVRRRCTAALGTMIPGGNILSLGSFSKILAPGLRLGWIQTSPSLMERLLDSGVINSGGSFNHFTSLVVREAIERGLQGEFLEQLRATYARRVEVMDEALQAHFDGRARWRKPRGGYFFWLEFDEHTDTTALRPLADRFQTGFQPGTNSSSRGALKNCLRLSFANYGEDAIREGVERLARLFEAHRDARRRNS